MSWASALTSVASYAVSPVILTINILLAVLRALATPWIHVVHYIFRIWVLLPLHILSKFEPLLIFLSVAGALGVTAGISLHFSSGYMHQLLDIRTGGEDNDYTTKKGKFVVDNGSSSNNNLTHPRQNPRDGRMYTTSAGSSRASLRDIMTAQNKPWLARNRNEEQTAMTSLWQVPAFKNERKEETKRDDESEIESEQVPRGERDREDLLATIILEEEEDDDYGEGEGEGEGEEEEEEDNEI
ncbi:predicted protein [Histoplasma capsulatum G186AR]|uniref:Uncharacterized protein n=1 Tax=Ajellomyces capsulatus (strain G186AR / H82 / ATCC MYA-2454 / RMSCC 2432) TaxID=447093 RepID=C0NZU9_AJECG|nr:uncharacterized protein HCBG_08679 [Histoplasma capsulatum G186AR]EEH03039.1 predicted protein [Histoplasma capsulatum G186AR]